MTSKHIDELIDATERAIRDDLDHIATLRKQINETQEHMKWAMQVMNSLKERKENGRDEEEHLPGAE